MTAVNTVPSSPAPSGYVDTTGGASGVGGASGSSGSSVYGLTQDSFFKLFLAQLQNQDPTSPMDETQMVSQLAQFSMIEMLQQLTTAMQGSQLAQASSLIGQTVSGTTSTGQAVSGVVDGVQQASSGMVLNVDGQSIDAANVTTIGTAPSAATSGGSATTTGSGTTGAGSAGSTGA